jgi:hypothetical protein
MLMIAWLASLYDHTAAYFAKEPLLVRPAFVVAKDPKSEAGRYIRTRSVHKQKQQPFY